MAAPRKYGDELRERATRMAVEARKDPATRSGAIPRIAEQLGGASRDVAGVGPAG
jgi:transposase